jgi:hypothetical protein
MACETERAAYLAAKETLDDANSDWWGGAWNVAAAGFSVVVGGAAVVGAVIAEIPTAGLATVAVVGAAAGTASGVAWTVSASIQMSEIDEDYDDAESAYDAALAAYCDCMD